MEQLSVAEKHLQQKNQLASRLGGTVALASLVFSALNIILGITPLIIFRIVVSLIILVMIQVLFRKIGHTVQFRYYVTVSMAITYLINVIYPSSSHVYALLYAILLIVLVYGEVKTVTLGCIIAIVGLLVSDIIEFSAQRLDPTNMVSQFSIAVIVCYMAIRYCRVNRRQTSEQMDTIQENANAQAEVANSIINLAEQLSQKFLEANEVSAKLNDSMESTHLSVNEIVEGAKTTAEAIEHQTNQTADISVNIEAVGEEATNIGEISAKVETTVKEGVDLIETLKNQATEVAAINLEAGKTTKALNDSIQDVQAITETILSISSQTNLLALNASIEAARAGEAGKGFAVVADEIRSLAESTREATEEIASIIERLTTDATSAANAMTKSADYANKQQELISETGDKLADIKNETEVLHNGVSDVKNSVSTVIAANSEIMDSISNLSATSEEVAASADAVLTVSDEAMTALENMNDALAEINSIAQQMEDVAKK